MPAALRFGPPLSAALADPLLAARVDLLLPQRDGVLERVDRLLARRERVGAVRARYGDHDARLADLDAAGAVVDRDLLDVVLRLQRVGELLHHPLGHALVGLVLEVLDVAAAGVVADGAG